MSDRDVVEIARRLIATPSPNLPGDERDVAALVTDLQRELGLPPPRVVAAQPHRPNLVTTLDFGPGGRHLVLNGHIDTKPVGDAAWTVDPFAGDVDGDRLYGLGAADMKAAVAAMLLAARDLLDEAPDAGQLTLLFVADEENGAVYGAQHLVDALDLSADAVVIGEPGGIASDWDNLAIVSRGIARLRLTAQARQGHSSLSMLLQQRNAGVDLARLVTALVDDVDLTVPANPDSLDGWSATLNAALRYEGGVGYGVLPEAVTAVTEVRVLPGMEPQGLLSAVRTVADRLSERTGATYEVSFDAPPNDWLDAATVDPSADIVKCARRACEKTFGGSPPLAVFPGTTDATWFGARGGIPTLPALGPGLLRRCHGADEWVSVEAARQAVGLYATLARSFCAGEGF